MATAGHCQELRSQILPSISTHPIKPRPHTSIFPMAKPFFFRRFTSLYLENAMYVCNRIKEIISDGKNYWTGVVLFIVFTSWSVISVFTVLIYILKKLLFRFYYFCNFVIKLFYLIIVFKYYSWGLFEFLFIYFQLVILVLPRHHLSFLFDLIFTFYFI